MDAGLGDGMNTKMARELGGLRAYFFEKREVKSTWQPRLIPLHTDKGRNFSKAIRNVIGYVSNPKKTHQGELVTGFGCNPETADGEFLLMKREYIAQTGRLRRKDDVIAYHLRQSFMPGEITPEEANRIGCELAKRFTHGQHAYVVATHEDRRHVQYVLYKGRF